MRGVLAAAFALIFACAAHADVGGAPLPAGLQISPGERVVFRIDADGAPHAGSRGPIPPSDTLPTVDYDTRVERVQSFRLAEPPPAPGELTFSLRDLDRGGFVLTLRNGLDHALLYDALLVVRRGSRITYLPTTICPVKGRSVGSEAWPQRLEEVVVSKVRTPPPGDLRCTGASELTAQTGAPARTCRGEAAGGALAVRLSLDARGETQAASAEWTIKGAAGGGLPLWLVLDYPMAGDVVAGRPAAAEVLDAVPLDPPPRPAAAASSLRVDGRAFARRPWRLYAERCTATLAAAPTAKRPIAFVGVVPFSPRTDDGGRDPGLTALLSAIGDGSVQKVEVRTEGDDGTLLNQGTFAVGSSPTRDAHQLASALAAAHAKATTPDGCAAPATARLGGGA